MAIATLAQEAARVPTEHVQGLGLPNLVHFRRIVLLQKRLRQLGRHVFTSLMWPIQLASCWL